MSVLWRLRGSLPTLWCPSSSEGGTSRPPGGPERARDCERDWERDGERERDLLRESRSLPSPYPDLLRLLRLFFDRERLGKTPSSPVTSRETGVPSAVRDQNRVKRGKGGGGRQPRPQASFAWPVPGLSRRGRSTGVAAQARGWERGKGGSKKRMPTLLGLSSSRFLSKL